ncbi:hypothetical protein QYE76_039110 [Lolium multiflorum]|uniref:Transposon protein, putative, CACTA, En/Spm sub-class n=1 Tax=Lolium multiflorum TaxID=4521 RepID=A0AAD8TAF2_LOLMU|nr:hypothetical protein QYE76_039110 [Lolium multiflorum]
MGKPRVALGVCLALGVEVRENHLVGLAFSFLSPNLPHAKSLFPHSAPATPSSSCPSPPPPARRNSRLLPAATPSSSCPSPPPPARRRRLLPAETAASSPPPPPARRRRLLPVPATSCPSSPPPARRLRLRPATSAAGISLIEQRMADNGWMYTGRVSATNKTDEWIRKTWHLVKELARGTKQKVQPLCPCNRCLKHHRRGKDDMFKHLLQYGYMPRYVTQIDFDEHERDRGESRHLHGRNRQPEEPPEPEEPEPAAKAFYDMIAAAKTPLYDGAEISQLDAISQCLADKTRYNTTRDGFEASLKTTGNMLPKGHCLPKSLHETRQLMSALNMDYQRIDCCEKGCVLFWKQFAEDKYCPICKAYMYEEVTGKDGQVRQSKIAKSILRYLPFIKRIQRLYLTEETAKQMTWHKMGTRIKDNQGRTKMGHPSDGNAWKNFDRKYPHRAADARNVRIVIATDGFNPYGPHYPGKNLSVYMQPIVDDLNHSWHHGTLTYDRASKTNFCMKVWLQYTMHDMPGYALTCGWCTAVPQTEASVQRRQKNFKKGKVVHEVTEVPKFDGIAVDAELRALVPAASEAGHQFEGYGVTHNWTHEAALTKLEYYKDLELPHNIDVMHTVKNVTESLFHTCLNIPGKSKDNVKARVDVEKLCDRKKLHMQRPTGRRKNWFKPHADFCLDSIQKKEAFKWLKYVGADANVEMTDELRCVSQGCNRDVMKYEKYDVNGFRFHTETHQKGRANPKTINTGVFTKGSDTFDYYGRLENVYELTFNRTKKQLNLVVFKCHWFDPRGGQRITKSIGLVEVKPSTTYTGADVYIVAHQAKQVYYLPYPCQKAALNGWEVVFQVSPHGNLPIPSEDDYNNIDPITYEGIFYQEEEDFGHFELECVLEEDLRNDAETRGESVVDLKDIDMLEKLQVEDDSDDEPPPVYQDPTYYSKDSDSDSGKEKQNEIDDEIDDGCGGKEDSSSLLKKMQQRKNNVRRSERAPRRNPRYEDGAGGGGGRGRGRGRGRGGGAGGGLGGGGGGGGWGGPDFEPPPSASGDVASGFFLEGPSREEAETESRAEEDSSRGNWTFPPGVKGRLPSSMIGALLRKFWPGKYYPLGTVPAGEKKLATTRTDYESAPGVGFLTAAEAVMRKFWCFYRVAPEVEETAANRTLRATCERLTPQVWYNQRITSAGHFWAERGERVHKPDIVGKNAKAEYEMTAEDYMSPHAEAWEEMVRTRWLKMDEDFAAVARRNAENRGDGGTHCGGNLSYERYKGKTRAALGPEEEMSDLEIYNKMRLKKPDLSQPQPSLPEYFAPTPRTSRTTARW